MQDVWACLCTCASLLWTELKGFHFLSSICVRHKMSKTYLTKQRWENLCFLPAVSLFFWAGQMGFMVSHLISIQIWRLQHENTTLRCIIFLNLPLWSDWNKAICMSWPSRCVLTEWRQVMFVRSLKTNLCIWGTL